MAKGYSIATFCVLKLTSQPMERISKTHHSSLLRRTFPVKEVGDLANPDRDVSNLASMSIAGERRSRNNVIRNVEHGVILCLSSASFPLRGQLLI